MDGPSNDTLWGSIIASIVGVYAWMVKMTLTRHVQRTDDIAKSLEDYKLEVAKNVYIKHEVNELVQNSIQPIVDSQQRIEDKIDRLIERELGK